MMGLAQAMRCAKQCKSWKDVGKEERQWWEWCRIRGWRREDGLTRRRTLSGPQSRKDQQHHCHNHHLRDRTDNFNKQDQCRNQHLLDDLRPHLMDRHYPRSPRRIIHQSCPELPNGLQVPQFSLWGEAPYLQGVVPQWQQRQQARQQLQHQQYRAQPQLRRRYRRY